MSSLLQHIPYSSTHAFSPLVNDFVSDQKKFVSLGVRPVSLSGMREAIDERLRSTTNRTVLVERLKEQYQGVETSAKVLANIELLANENTLTITTAHQNNLFTGPLYFIYKILHVIQLAKTCQQEFPAYNFVPVFYLGSEDADLEELNHIHLADAKLVWETKQAGAVGRMKVDASLLQLLDRLEGELGVLPAGKDWIGLLRECYTKESSIASATIRLVNSLFSKFGLVVLNPDDAQLKKLFLPVLQRELFRGDTESIMTRAIEKLAQLGYEAQAHVRPINLFYLQEGSRQRIEKIGDQWQVVGTTITFDKASLELELNQHPERFSPNVILRGLYQCTLLPDVAFVGGGSEISYWLQFGNLFNEHQIPFPVLVLRNSFQLLDTELVKKIAVLQLKPAVFFQTIQEISNGLLTDEDLAEFSLQTQLENLHSFYGLIKLKASSIDATLLAHVAALEKKAADQLVGLEKKMKKAVKKRYSSQEQQVAILKNRFSPKGQLQERTLNAGEYISRYGFDWLDQIAKASLGFEQQFTLLELA